MNVDQQLIPVLKYSGEDYRSHGPLVCDIVYCCYIVNLFIFCTS